MSLRITIYPHSASLEMPNGGHGTIIFSRPDRFLYYSCKSGYKSFLTNILGFLLIVSTVYKLVPFDVFLQSNGVEETRILAEQHSKEAIKVLKQMRQSDSLKALHNLAHLVLNRKK